MAQIFSDEEVETLVMRFIEGAGEGGITQDEAGRLLDWAQDCRLGAAQLKMVMDGRLIVRWPEDGELLMSLKH